jgi:hypothetical protein
VRRTAAGDVAAVTVALARGTPLPRRVRATVVGDVVPLAARTFVR